MGGLSGSACYITAQSKLPTSRLLQIRDENPSLSPCICGLENIHTLTAPTLEVLLHILSVRVPVLQSSLASQFKKPLRLVVIDSIASLFQSAEQQTSTSLHERSKHLTDLSKILHDIAQKYEVACLVVNDVKDVFHSYQPMDNIPPGAILYREQNRWFGRASVPGGHSKEVGLGLVWANQVNARIMLIKTNKRLKDDVGLNAEIPAKRRKMLLEKNSATHPNRILDDDEGIREEAMVRIRTLCVVFSPLSAFSSVDFIVSAGGLKAIKQDSQASQHPVVLKEKGGEVALPSEELVVDELLSGNSLDDFSFRDLEQVTDEEAVDEDLGEMEPLAAADEALS